MKLMSLSDIQSLPVATRIKILWISTAVIAVALAGIWIYSTGRQVKQIAATNLSLNPNPETPKESVASENKYTAVEWTERQDGKLLVYFKSNNTTDSILNFSTQDRITLTMNGEAQAAKAVTDRQGNLFVSKVLSQTQNFGIATFDDKTGNKAQIKFDNLFFENSTDTTFNETMDLDLNKLTKQPNTR